MHLYIIDKSIYTIVLNVLVTPAYTMYSTLTIQCIDVFTFNHKLHNNNNNNNNNINSMALCKVIKAHRFLTMLLTVTIIIQVYDVCNYANGGINKK